MTCCCNNNDPQSCGCRKYMPIIIILAVIIGFGAYKYMTAPDERTAVERVGDAVKALPNGVDAATKQLEDKSAVDKLGDSIKEIAQ